MFRHTLELLLLQSLFLLGALVRVALVVSVVLVLAVLEPVSMALPFWDNKALVTHIVLMLVVVGLLLTLLVLVLVLVVLWGYKSVKMCSYENHRVLPFLQLS